MSAEHAEHEDRARALARAVELLRGAHQTTAGLLQLNDMDELCEAVVAAVPTLGFAVAVLNVVRDDDTVEVTNVIGPPSAQARLLGVHEELAVWRRVLEACEDWGDLRFLPHDVQIVDELNDWVVMEGEVLDGVGPWFPTHGDSPVATEPWHPEDSLFAPMYDKSGELLAILCVDLPIDGRRPGPVQREMLALFAGHARVAIENSRLHEQAVRAHQELEREKETFRLAFDAAPTGIAMADRLPEQGGRLLRVNDSLCRLLGHSPESLLGSRLRDHLLPPDTTPLASDDLPVPEGEVEQSELAVRRRGGGVLWLAQSRITVRDDGRPLYDLIHLLDISARKVREHALEHDARHDPLTGLSNRRAMLERIDALDLGHPLTIVFIDIDGFKAVNDTLGHTHGDQLLINVARRVASCVRTEDLVVRYGGDEFVVIAEGLSPQQSDHLCERIEDAVSRPMGGELSGVTITATNGVATGVPHRRDDAHQLLARADRQMLEAKSGRRRASSG